MFTSSPPTHPKIGCAHHLHIWKTFSHGLSRRWPSSWSPSLREGGPNWAGKGSVLGGLDLEVRKRVHSLLSIFSPLLAVASAMAPSRWGATREPGSGTSWRQCLVMHPASRPQLAEHSLQELKKDFWNKELNCSSKPSINNLIQRTKVNSCVYTGTLSLRGGYAITG